MELGKRLIYDSQTGKILNGTFEEMAGSLQEGLRPLEIDFIDLPYGYAENNFRLASAYHIDVTKPKDAPIVERIVIDGYVPQVPTEADRIKELEDQLLMQENEKVGGIL
ncbi:hypothetical protein BVG16_16295 [Paenibacillus selenitireducens]|uniref:Uncharacterized protein n=1 Tax=Paenibacillus selenitireducens TaxID=1324314 RepID=A0A1T2XA64_9BACL|nr:hypothetical protein [Paenibacillus selenitireducens]OPA76730.1 hypothetical protein BVG16_16295 [Paenibacillus selenitireducens]